MYILDLFGNHLIDKTHDFIYTFLFCTFLLYHSEIDKDGINEKM